MVWPKPISDFLTKFENSVMTPLTKTSLELSSVKNMINVSMFLGLVFEALI